jgi:hypothetical protein
MGGSREALRFPPTSPAPRLLRSGKRKVDAQLKRYKCAPWICLFLGATMEVLATAIPAEAA